MDLVEGQYGINFGDLERKLAGPKVKTLFTCNLQNPTDRYFTKEELTRMGELCVRNNVMIRVDEIHVDIIPDGHKFVPLCGISGEFANHSVTFINPVKTSNVVGLRTAVWFTHNKEIYRRTMNQQTYKKGVGRNIFGNAALMACYNHGDDYADQYVTYLNEAKNQVVTYINENIPKIRAINPEATFMIWMDRRGPGFKTQKEPRDLMFKNTRVSLNDRTTFGGKEGTGFMRFNSVAPRAVVMEGLERIREAADRL